MDWLGDGEVPLVLILMFCVFWWLEEEAKKRQSEPEATCSACKTADAQAAGDEDDDLFLPPPPTNVFEAFDTFLPMCRPEMLAQSANGTPCPSPASVKLTSVHRLDSVKARAAMFESLASPSCPPVRTPSACSITLSREPSGSLLSSVSGDLDSPRSSVSSGGRGVCPSPRVSSPGSGLAKSASQGACSPSFLPLARMAQAEAFGPARRSLGRSLSSSPHAAAGAKRLAKPNMPSVAGL